MCDISFIHRIFILTYFQLVGFIASPSPQIRAVAIENLVPYSTTDPSIFKANKLTPVKNLKVLVQDRPVREILPSLLAGASC